jgi:hypothetical protein
MNMVFNGHPFVPQFPFMGAAPLQGAPYTPMIAPPIDPMHGASRVSMRIDDPRQPHVHDPLHSLPMRGIGATRMGGGNAGDYMTPNAPEMGRHGSIRDPVSRAVMQMAQSQIPHNFFYHHILGFGQ